MTPALFDLDLQGGLIDHDWLVTPHDGTVVPDETTVSAVRQFLTEAWKARAAERGLPVPTDLSSSCKFGSLLSKCLFGGEIKGHYDHLFVEVDGRVIDLSEGASDVAALSEPYRHDREFLSEPDLAESLMSCLPRVKGWIEELLPRLDVAISHGRPR